jgi:hypothetical protein
MGETNFSEMNKTSVLKKLSGGDLIGFEYKNKDPFEEVNYAKIIIATNNLPATNDKTVGFYRRWMIIDFPNQFSEKKDILAEIPEEEYSALAVKCSMILKDLLDSRTFTNEGSIDERMKKYEDHSNPLENFKSHTNLNTYDKFSDPYNIAFINNVFNLTLIGNYYYSNQNITNLMLIDSIPQIDEYYYMDDSANNIIGIKQYMAKDNMIDISNLMSVIASIVTTPLLSTFRYQVNIIDSVLLSYLTNDCPEWCYQIKPSIETVWSEKRHHNDYYYKTDETPNGVNTYDIRLYTDVNSTTPIIYMTDTFNEISVSILT